MKYGLKNFLNMVKYGCKIIWRGHPKYKVNKLLFETYKGIGLVEEEISLLEKERKNLDDGKVQYELTRLEQINTNNKKYGYVQQFEVRESEIKRIDIGVLKWFKEEWFRNKDDMTEEKVKFYLWLEENYLGHFQLYLNNKNEYFEGLDIQNKFEARLAIYKVGMVGIGYIVTFLAGKNWNDILNLAIQLCHNNSIFQGKFEKVGMGITLLFLCLIFVFLCYGVKTLFSAEYLKRDNVLRQQKQTWVRHVEVIANYQQEMLEFVWCLGKYEQCCYEKEKEKVFMVNIKKIWMENNRIFQSNMKKDSGEKKM